MRAQLAMSNLAPRPLASSCTSGSSPIASFFAPYTCFLSRPITRADKSHDKYQDTCLTTMIISQSKKILQLPITVSNTLCDIMQVICYTNLFDLNLI